MNKIYTFCCVILLILGLNPSGIAESNLLAELPLSVQSALKQKYPDGKILKISIEESDQHAIHYILVLQVQDEKRILTFQKNGTLISDVLDQNVERSKKENETKEILIRIPKLDKDDLNLDWKEIEKELETLGKELGEKLRQILELELDSLKKSLKIDPDIRIKVYTFGDSTQEKKDPSRRSKRISKGIRIFRDGDVIRIQIEHSKDEDFNEGAFYPKKRFQQNQKFNSHHYSHNLSSKHHQAYKRSLKVSVISIEHCFLHSF
ncbi:MAG: hypothetical protein N2450_05870 [bacterium]|nr:hypothetical protein [bacterium]